jgi:hypothetical protein
MEKLSPPHILHFRNENVAVFRPPGLVDKIIAGFVLILWSRQKTEIYSDYFEKLDTCRGMVKAKANGAIRIAVVAGSRLDRHMKVARHSAR